MLETFYAHLKRANTITNTLKTNELSSTITIITKRLSFTNESLHKVTNAAKKYVESHQSGKNFLI